MPSVDCTHQRIVFIPFVAALSRWKIWVDKDDLKMRPTSKIKVNFMSIILEPEGQYFHSFIHNVFHYVDYADADRGVVQRCER